MTAQAFRGTLCRGVGIKAGHVVALLNAPAGFAQTLGDLPSGASLVDGPGSDADLAIWFSRSLACLEHDLPSILVAAQHAPVWIAWPKKASGVKSDLSQQVVRKTGLAAGMVDYKVCSIDATWSGLLFTVRQDG